MTLNEVITIAAGRAPSESEVEAAARSLDMSPADLCDAFAQTVAERFVKGEISWEIADAAMNGLFSFAYAVEGPGLPQMAWRVFEAFDEGEYRHPGEPEEFQGEARTRFLLEWTLSGSDGVPPEFEVPQREERVRATAAAIARRALSHGMSSILAARELNALRFHVGLPENDPDFLTFVTIDSETDALPFGPVRKFWAAEALAEKAEEILRAEAWAKEVGENAFRGVVLRFGGLA